MSTLHTCLDAARKAELAQDPAEHPRRAHPVQTSDPVLRALSTAEAAFSRYAAHHLRQAGQPGEDVVKRRQQAAENADLAQAMREGIIAHFARSHEVPQDWKLVPCEPTPEMYAAVMREGVYYDDPDKVRAVLRGEYQSMLSATPKLVTAQAQHPDDAAVESDERAIGSPARVGNNVFCPSVPERVVIAAAKDAYTRHQMELAEIASWPAESERLRRKQWDAANGPLEQAERQLRTDAQIVAQTEELAAELDRWRWGGVFEDVTYRSNNATRARHCWEMACKAQEILTDTDPENAVAEVDGAQGEEGGAA